MSTAYLGIQEKKAQDIKSDTEKPVERVIERKSRSGGQTYLFIGIDDFSRLCAASSKFHGSELIKVVKKRFGTICPDTVEIFDVPRTGFLLAINEYRAEESIKSFANEFVNETSSPFDVNGDTINVSVNIGIASKTEEVNSSTLLDQAQYAYHLASTKQAKNIEIYDPENAKRMRNEVSLKNDLYRALDEDEFFLKYQPIISLDDNSICGAEALVRWQHPERGLISPGEFIPLAEKTGQILFLDRWVLTNVVKRIEAWNEKYDENVPVGINISAWQFRDNYLVDKFKKIIDRTSIPPELLKVEITETSMMSDVDRTRKLLQKLNDIGVKIALDDFGTGHSTFEYLAEFPIDQLKIDRSFLDFDDVYTKNQKLLEIMIQTGKRIGVEILVEGVEQENQLNFIRNHGCHKTQGFLFSKPVKPGEFEMLQESETLKNNF